MDSNLYNKKIVCPICNKNIEMTKMKMNSSKLEKKDTDLCPYYEGISPLYYDICVCEECGYAEFAEKFEYVKNAECALIKKNITVHWKKHEFTGDRDLDKAIESYKVALLNYQAKNAKFSDKAKVCLRLGWLYRFKNDIEKEKTFLNHALDNFTESYSKESFPIDKMDEATCMYLIAELHLRTGNPDESLKWFGKIISNQAGRNNSKVMDMTRDRLEEVKKVIEDNKNNIDVINSNVVNDIK